MGSVRSKPKLKVILTSIIRSKTNESSQVLNAPILNIFLKFLFLKKSEGLSTELFCQSNFSILLHKFLFVTIKSMSKIFITSHIIFSLIIQPHPKTIIHTHTPQRQRLSNAKI